MFTFSSANRRNCSPRKKLRAVACSPYPAAVDAVAEVLDEGGREVALDAAPVRGSEVALSIA